ncbi:hypothetical protein ANN_14176 [Periplaneta americana]|uniref:Uncharacterized protein n=1 Tax=Periplaneta americana TaxID=6978 RepID=A0ABQ8SVM6_PERAM|nr:hypothetical protein ANN_14176 [Periplaneta americana]
MAGLCEGGNEPPGSLKANAMIAIETTTVVFLLRCILTSSMFKLSDENRNTLHGLPASLTDSYTLQVADRGDDLQIWRVSANILNKQSWTADKEWSSSLGVGRRANNPSPLMLGDLNIISSLGEMGTSAEAGSAAQRSPSRQAGSLLLGAGSHRSRLFTCMGPVPTQHRDALGELR